MMNHDDTHSDLEIAASKIMQALRGLRFGSVEITVHEGRIVQIERKEKTRLSVQCPTHGDGPGTANGLPSLDR